VEALGEGWTAEETLAIGVYCALVAEDVRHAAAAVNHSGDSDSTGSVCGNLLGVQHGETALPPAWIAELEGRSTILQLADDFAMEMTQAPRCTGRRAPARPGWTLPGVVTAPVLILARS